MVNCNCIANDNGHCVAETCRGEIQALDARFGSPEVRRQAYACAARSFADYFSEDYTDDNLEE